MKTSEVKEKEEFSSALDADLEEAYRKAEEAQRALRERPKISIRLRIAMSFTVLFVIICGMAIGSLMFISQVDRKQKFLEKISNYAFEIQQARRYEKNFFLYGTNMEDALINVHTAQSVLRLERKHLISVLGEDRFNEMVNNLMLYDSTLTQLATLMRNKEAAPQERVLSLEKNLRRYGADILTMASASIQREREEVDRLISTGKIASIGSIFIFLFCIVYIVIFLTGQILQPINRAVEYTRRIAEGDFTPITPKRKYRDEFSNLAIAINRMINEIRVRQEQLTQSRKMAAIGNLTAGIAHELNNPLNNISLITETLLEEFDDYSRDEKQKMLRDIFSQVERASSTVRNLLDFTRVEKPMFSSVCIADVLQNTIKLLQNELKLNDIRLEYHCQKNLPPIQANAKNIQQVFLNLILNSIQAMPNGGEIRVSCSLIDDHHIRVDVSDTGVGIPKENLDKIFEPFFTTKEVGKGTGLGLAVSYGIIKSHRGRITVQSQVGKGTTFSVFLPIQNDEIKVRDNRDSI